MGWLACEMKDYEKGVREDRENRSPQPSRQVENEEEQSKPGRTDRALRNELRTLQSVSFLRQ
jgi:hypothetical protein